VQDGKAGFCYAGQRMLFEMMAALRLLLRPVSGLVRGRAPTPRSP
jgi:hypothetical protein